MASIVELRPHARQEFTASLGMAVFLGSWAMMFAALFFAYAFMRARLPVWPPADVPRLPLGLPALNTVVLLASSATMARGVGALKRGRRAELTRWVGVTFVLGAVFLALQLAVWISIHRAGLHASSGLYGSAFYALTIFHGLHVAAGLIVLAWIFVRSLRGGYTEHATTTVRLSAMFWHFVDVVWILMFFAVYLF